MYQPPFFGGAEGAVRGRPLSDTLAQDTLDFRKCGWKFASPAEGKGPGISLEICDRGALSLPPRRVRQPETTIVSPPIVSLATSFLAHQLRAVRAGCCPATHRALRYNLYDQPGAMDDDAAIRAALLEVREAGDITITQYLAASRRRRAAGQEAGSAGGRAHAMSE